MTDNAQSATKKLYSRENTGESFNFVRKVFHLTGLIIPAIYLFDLFDYLGLFWFKDDTRSIAFYILLGLFLFMLVIEVMRFNFRSWQQLFINTVGKLLKEKEFDRPHGSLPFIAANAIVIGFFPKDIAVISILFLNFGDPSAAFFGGKFGQVRFYNGKSLVGMIAGILGAFLSGVVFMALISLFPSILPASDLFLWDSGGLLPNTMIVIMAGAMAAFIFELFSGEGIVDDNITIPVGGGLVMCLTLAYIHGYPAAYYINYWRDLIVPL